MPVEIHVACRRDPSTAAALFQSCQVAQLEVASARTIRAWSPRGHSTLLIRDRDLAAVVTLHCHGATELGREYAELIARAFEGVVVIDGEVVECAQHDRLAPVELAAAWALIHGRIGTILDERQQDKQRKRRAWDLSHPPAKRGREDGGQRDWSSV
ncbi:MAG: hypothetical protein H0X17_01240 [Deltaproteobacteria bacterium]|nr:hypothetical protein [Deltaproteobacteria bacterium]